METKKCADCKIEKPINKFGKDKYNKDGLNYDCKECKNKKARARDRANPDAVKRRNSNTKEWRKTYYSSEKGIESSRRSHLKREYGLTLEDYEKMSKAQDHKCAICGSTEMNYKNKVLCVDHNHTTGAVRGLLCGLCNAGIGHLKDNINLLEEAIKYLKHYDK